MFARWNFHEFHDWHHLCEHLMYKHFPSVQIFYTGYAHYHNVHILYSYHVSCDGGDFGRDVWKTIEHLFKHVRGDDSSSSKAVQMSAVLLRAAKKEVVKEQRRMRKLGRIMALTYMAISLPSKSWYTWYPRTQLAMLKDDTIFLYFNNATINTNTMAI